KTEIASLDNQLKLYMAIRQVISENADTQKYSDGSKKIEIPAAEVEQEWKELFKDSKIKHESLKGDSCSYSAFIYDKKTKTYIQEPNPDHCTSRNEAIIAVVNDTVVNGNTIEIYENFGYVESNYNLETASISYNIYKDMAKTEKVATTTEFGITPYLEQLSTYKYTFEKNGNTYSFVKVELAQ
ncbi:MAG: hypothetical protein PUB18_01865, partial [bacterium]|nr:hypothetical protein [bacterium]